MAEESEKRFKAVMDKLFHAPRKSISKSTTNKTTQSNCYSGNPSPRGVKRPNTGTDLSISKGKSISRGSAEAPLCRPWDRGDLMKRLATFKSMTWFGKPQVVNAVNCARKGWINVDADTIACEACAARLFFTTPSAWVQHQVEKAALVFSLKLDSGHKLLCPWIDNACDEKLAQFPPTTAEVLVDEYKKRLSALFHLVALPEISASAIDHMKSPLLTYFLRGFSDGCGNESADASCTEGLRKDNEMMSSVSYYQAQKLISLCGWEPRLLPYIVDCKNQQTEPNGDANCSNSSQRESNRHNSGLLVYSSGKDAFMDANGNPMAYGHCDPSSCVLDCRLCGASVGLWTFSTVPRPLELLRVVGYTKVGGGNDSVDPKESSIDSEIDVSGTSDPGHGHSTICPAAAYPTFSTETQSNLNLTIAGGPPPTKQNFKATISLPVIGRNLRARFSSELDLRDRVCLKNPVAEGKNHGDNALTGIGFQTEDKGLLSDKQVDDGPKFPETSSLVSITEDPMPNALNAVDGSKEVDKLSEVAEDSAATNPEMGVDNISQAGEHSTVATFNDVTVTNVENTETDASMNVEANSSDLQQIPVTARVCSPSANNQDATEIVDRAQPHNSDILSSRRVENIGHQRLGDAMKFEVIGQHRPFCPWIASVSNSLPGWHQTLSALHRQQEFSCPSATEAPSPSLIEVDDPIASVKKLFTPPSAKKSEASSRFKLKHQTDRL